MTELRNELAIGEENESLGTVTESSPSGSSVYESPEVGTEIEPRARVHRCVWVLLLLLAALGIITLVISLFVIIGWLLYQNNLPSTSITVTTPKGYFAVIADSN